VVAIIFQAISAFSEA